MYSTLVPAALLFAARLCHGAPTPSSNSHVSAAPLGQGMEQNSSLAPWQVYSLREQPFINSELSFNLIDPNGDKHETECKTALPMSGYATCSDGKTTFIYGGVSYQYGETWLSIQRRDVEDCSDVKSTPTESTQGAEQKQECEKRAASGTLNLPSNFWQQPGWNSWVHPEVMDVSWGWSS